MKRKWKRTLSIVLSVAMLFSMTGMNTVFATEGDQTIGASGLCEHHRSHTADCGFTEGTPEVPCAHEHGDECYKEVTDCVHEHTGDCYDDAVETASDSNAGEPVNCSHICDEDSGCITEDLDCQHSHDEDCGYIAAVPGTPCTFKCEECADKDSGEQAPPPADDGVVIQTITSFVGFDGTNPLETIEVTEKTTVAAIGLPETLAVTIDRQDGEAYIPVTWECDDDYENTEYETYDFTLVWDAEAYALAESMDENALPYITVNIAGAKYPLAKGNIPEDVTALITKINVWDPDGAGTTHTADQITANWDAENDTVTVSDQLTGDGVFSASQGLALDIPAGVTVMWQPSCNFSAVGLFISGEGDFVLDGSAKLTAQSSSPQTNHTAIYNDGGNVTVPSQTKVQATGNANKPAIYNEGVLEVSGTVSSEGGYAIQNKSGATANILDGAVVSASGNVETIRNETGCTLTISGGTISHSRDYGMAVVNLGALTMADGEIKSTGTQGQGLSSNPGSSAFVSGGAITASGTDGTAFRIDGGTIALTGGTFTGTTRFSGSAKAILAYLAGVTCPLPYSISGNNGTVVEIDSLSIPASRHGTGEGITVKVAGQTWDNHLTTTAEWDTSSGTPQIVVDVTDSADTFTYTANMDWGTKTGGDTQPAFTSDNHLECGEQGNMLDLTVTGFTPTSYSLSGTVPEGVSVQEDEGTWALVVLYGAPVGVHTFTVNATDGNTTITQTFTLTVNSDSATVTTTIDCTGGLDANGPGWAWVQETRTLTLTDVAVNVSSGNAVKVPANATVVGMGEVTITATGYGIHGMGNLTIEGTVGDINGGYGIYAGGALTIDSGAAVGNVTATSTLQSGASIYAASITIAGTVGDVTGNGNFGIRANSGAVTIASGAVVGRISGAYRAGVSASAGIFIYAPVTVSGSRAFETIPTIAAAGLGAAAWSKNKDGSSPETGPIEWNAANYVEIGAVAPTVVTTADDLKAALTAANAQIISVTEDISLTNLAAIAVGADHTVNIATGKTVTIDGDTNINPDAHTLTIAGAGTESSTLVCDRDSCFAIHGAASGTLILNNLTVNVIGGNGICTKNVELGSDANLVLNVSDGDDLVIVNGDFDVSGEVDIQSFYSRAIAIQMGALTIKDGGTVTVGAGTEANRGIEVYGSCDLVVESGGTLTGNVGAGIYLNQSGSSGARVTGVAGKFIDRGVTLTENGQVTVAADTTPASQAGLTKGLYLWNGSAFAKSTPAASVTTAEGLKTELEKTTAQTITLGANIKLNEVVNIGADHTLVIPADYTLTTLFNSSSAFGQVRIGTHTLTINGGGTILVSSDIFAGLSGAPEGTLNLENITVNLLNPGRNGIQAKTVNVNSGATINLNGTGSELIYMYDTSYTLNINSGGKIDIQNFSDTGISCYGTLNLETGGQITVGSGSGDNHGISIANTGTFNMNGGTLTSTDGGAVYLTEGATVKGMNGKLNDRGTDFTASGQVTVGAESATASATGLSAGQYVWNGSLFAKSDSADITTVTTAAELETALKATTASTINVTDNITLAGSASLLMVNMGADHTLNISSGKILTIGGGTGNNDAALINLNGHTLTVTGNSTVKVVINNYGSNGIYGNTGTLNLENVEVEVTNSVQNGLGNIKTLNIKSGAAVTLNGDGAQMMRLNDGQTAMVESGGTITITKHGATGIVLSGGELHINGGAVHVNSSSGAGIYAGSGTLKLSSGTLDGTGTIYLYNGCKVEGLSGKFTDRGTPFTASGAVTVGLPSVSPAANGLTQGGYTWDGSNTYEKSGYTVSGTVKDSSGAGISGAAVTLEYVYAATPYVAGTATTDSAGAYTFSNISASGYSIREGDKVYNKDYLIKASKDGYGPTTSPNFSVAGNDVTGKDITLPPGSGTTTYAVTVTGGSASPTTAAAGETVTLTANAAPSGQRFKEWTIDPAVTFTDGTSTTSSTAKFTMPGQAVTAAASYENIPATVTGVTVSPATANVQKGTTRQFGATVTGTGAYSNAVTWSVTGGGAGTSIDTNGVLTVAAGETAATLTVTATSTADTSKKGTASVTVTSSPVTKYLVTVNGGTGGAEYETGNTVTITATVPLGKIFKNWTVESGGVTLANASSASTTFTMPANAVTVTASFEDIPAGKLYDITFNPNGGTLNDTLHGPQGNFLQTDQTTGKLVDLPTASRTNHRFDGWFTAVSGGTQITLNTVFTQNTTIYAHWTYTGGGSTGDGGGGSGGGGGGSTTTTPPTVTTDPTKPNTPTDAKTEVKATVDSTGKASATVPEKSVTDAIKAAQDAAKKNGTEKNGISVTIDLKTDKAASSIAATLPVSSINELVKAGVTELKIESGTGDIRLDLATLKAIQAAGGGNVTVIMTKADVSKLSPEAQKVIGNRPVFDLSIMVGGKAVTTFGGGSVSVAILYTLGSNEIAGNVQAVYVDGNGKVSWLTNSSYDTNGKELLFSTGHFSIFGVGYKQDTPVFTDITNHWAKNDIEFVAARGLLSGTGNNQFSPDTGMTRGMFVTALGRQAGIDSTKYQNTKFTDVAANAYYAPYVAWAAEMRITSGTSVTTFSPDKTITRQELAVLMQNYAKAMGYTMPKTRKAVTFADAGAIGGFAKDAVKAMQMAGVMNGKDGNKFDPTGTATRAEVAATLHRYVELVKSASRTVNGRAYNFNFNGEAALPPTKKTGTYTVQKGDSFSRIASKVGCTIAELEQLNGKSRYDIIYAGQVLKEIKKKLL